MGAHIDTELGMEKLSRPGIEATLPLASCPEGVRQMKGGDSSELGLKGSRV